MAYCPKCKKEVAERWIECPVCRTEVIRKERKDDGVILNRPPGKKEAESYNFISRIKGVFTFNEKVFDDLSVAQPIGQAVLLFIANIMVAVIFIYPRTYMQLAAQLPTANPLMLAILFAVGFALSTVLFLIIVGITHLIIRTLGGQGTLTGTFVIMCFVGFTWGSIGNALGGLLIWTGFPLLVLYALSLITWVITAISYMIAFSVACDLPRGKALVVVLISSVLQVALGFFVGIAMGTIMIILMTLKMF
jgi:hypothetical protein